MHCGRLQQGDFHELYVWLLLSFYPYGLFILGNCPMPQCLPILQILSSPLFLVHPLFQDYLLICPIEFCLVIYFSFIFVCMCVVFICVCVCACVWYLYVWVCACVCVCVFSHVWVHLCRCRSMCVWMGGPRMMSRIILYLLLSETQGVLIKFRASLYD